MKVTIVNCYHDSNKGSSAILWGLIRRLQDTGLVKSISLVSMFQKTHPFYESSLRHIRAEFPDVVIVGAPLPRSHEYAANRYKKIGEIRSPLARLLDVVKASIRLKFLTPEKKFLNDAYHEIAMSDLVVDRGGPFFAANNPLFNLSLYHNAYPLFIAKKFGVAFGFAPGSFGPFASSWSRRLMRKLCEDAAFIMAREPISKDALIGHGVDHNRIILTLDNAFWVDQKLSRKIKLFMKNNDIEPRKFLVVTTRAWYVDQLKKYHQELASTINCVIPRYFQKVVLVPNMIDPIGQMGDDMKATKDLYHLIEKKEYVRVLDEDLPPNELVGFYGQAGLLLGTRLHSVIMALAAGTPAVAVAYSGHKTQGVMQAVDLQQYTMELDTFSSETAFSLLISALSSRIQIQEKIDSLRQEGNAIFNRSLQALTDSRGSDR